MILKKHLSRDQGLSDLLNYAHLIDDGVMINKDGAFLTSYKFRGPDINSASGGELDALTAIFNRMVTFLEDGWMIHVDELRVPSLTYPEQGDFPDNVSVLIDEERRQLYESEGTHYENFQFITFVWKFPLPVVKATRHWFVEGISKDEDDQNLSKLLKHFYEIVERCVGLISTQFVLEKLNSADLLSYLNTCITGDLLPVACPPEGCFIDVALGRRPVIGGYVPQIGDKFVYVLSVIGYLNEETIPGLLEEMGTYPLVYRWSNRFIPLSEGTAEREIKRYQKNWNNKVKGFVGIIKEVISGKLSHKVNYDALQMSHQTNEALTANSNQATRFGYWTSEIVLMNESVDLLAHAAKDLTRYLEQSGFACLKEDVNAFDAWLGTIPGHGSCNVRRVFINSINLAHMLPLNTIWAGSPLSSTASLLPPQSPPMPQQQARHPFVFIWMFLMSGTKLF
jgi:type IV secretory pathway VirB4 component